MAEGTHHTTNKKIISLIVSTALPPADPRMRLVFGSSIWRVTAAQYRDGIAYYANSGHHTELKVSIAM
jgi:hypothetical protein